VLTLKIGDHLDKVDRILAIESNGAATLMANERTTRQDEGDISTQDDGVAGNESSGDNSAVKLNLGSQSKEIAGADTEAASPQANTSLWLFYLGSMSTGMLTAWVFVTALGALVERSPGKLYLKYMA
jgi:hypothetical protein